jgi:uroporphyrinogen-III synthase
VPARREAERDAGGKPRHGGPLAGRGIVVTRPREQAGGLAEAIERAGGIAFRFPAIEIEDVQDLGPLLSLVDRLDEYGLAVFISPSAVAKAMNLIRLRRGDRAWPAQLRVAAIGRGSRRALEQQGFNAVIAPSAQADSEALLEMPELSSVQGQRVLIFRGDGGRELLGDTLRARGAEVTYAECYRRGRPRIDCAPLLAAWARGAVHAVTVSSGEGLANLFDMLGKLGQQWLRSTPLFVPHPRLVGSAERLGIREIRVAGTADEEVVRALVAYFAGAK